VPRLLKIDYSYYKVIIYFLIHLQNEAVYLFTEGTSVDCCRELLMEKVGNSWLLFCVFLFTIDYLPSLLLVMPFFLLTFSENSFACMTK
jgi:hypothetical protein